MPAICISVWYAQIPARYIDINWTTQKPLGWDQQQINKGRTRL